MTWLGPVTCEYLRPLLPIRHQKLLSSFPNDLFFKGEVLIWVVDTSHSWWELVIDEVFDLVVDQDLLDRLRRSLFICEGLEGFPAPEHLLSEGTAVQLWVIFVKLLLFDFFFEMAGARLGWLKFYLSGAFL